MIKMKLINEILKYDTNEKFCLKIITKKSI